MRLLCLSCVFGKFLEETSTGGAVITAVITSIEDL